MWGATRGMMSGAFQTTMINHPFIGGISSRDIQTRAFCLGDHRVMLPIQRIQDGDPVSRWRSNPMIFPAAYCYYAEPSMALLPRDDRATLIRSVTKHHDDDQVDTRRVSCCREEGLGIDDAARRFVKRLSGAVVRERTNGCTATSRCEQLRNISWRW